jgi:hypothetical protein
VHGIGYIGWLGHSNLGDEACFQLFDKRLRDFSRGTLKAEPFDERFPDQHPFAVVGGGTLLSCFSRPVDCILRVLREADIPYGIVGTSVEQLDLPDICDWPDISIDPAGRDLLVANVEAAEIVALRDNRSQEILWDLGVKRLDLEVVGDLAFLCPPDEVLYSPSHTIPTRAIGVNIGTSHNNIYGRNEAYVMEETVAFVDEITAAGYHVVRYAVWPDDLPVQQVLYDRCSHKSNVLPLPFLDDFRSLAGTVRKLDAVVAMKLHGLLFAAISGVPPIAICYREKCIAMMETMGLGNLAARTDTPNLAKRLVSLFRDLQVSRDHYRQVLSCRLSSLVSSAEQSVQTLVTTIETCLDSGGKPT